MAAKKLVLFIVEGITDQNSLGALMEKLKNDVLVYFAVTGGDITTREGVTPGNITSKVGNLVREFSGRTFSPKDFQEVIHLVDLDGAFMEAEHIRRKNCKDPIYTDEYIYTPNIQQIAKRNARKADNLKKLISLRKVWRTIPYQVYFFSCNLDHVLHDNANIPWREKFAYSGRFEDRFYDHPEKFLEYIRDHHFAVPGPLPDSWQFIQAEENSLKKYSNFHLYFDSFS